jgi:2,4-dienoyl-CoA reductase-like NADH-dependent reductase (Old Yellow Enzyme family)
MLNVPPRSQIDAFLLFRIGSCGGPEPQRTSIRTLHICKARPIQETDTTTLFSPLSIRSVTFRNRIGLSPLAQASAINGHANDWHLVHLGSRAIGGAGLILMEDTAVEPRGRITQGHHGIWSDDYIAGLARITTFLRQQGAVPGIQIAHSGRKGSTPLPWKGGAPLTETEGAWQTIAPSPIPFDKSFPVPKEMTIADIHSIIDAFSAAADRACRAGFEVLEIHAAHGYLLNEFLSPLTNHRTDTYGGSRERRMRIVLEVAEQVRGVWRTDLPLFVRVSATDWARGGWTIEDSIVLTRHLAEKGVDLVDVSSGGIVPDAQIPLSVDYQVGLAGRIRKEAGVLTAAVGLITDPVQADSILTDGRADMVLIGREFMRDPYWPTHAATVLGEDVGGLVPPQYREAWKHQLRFKHPDPRAQRGSDNGSLYISLYLYRRELLPLFQAPGFPELPPNRARGPIRVSPPPSLTPATGIEAR